MRQLALLTVFIGLLISCNSKPQKETVTTKKAVPPELSTVNLHKASTVNYIRGIDISDFQSNINWEAVKESQVKFVFIKATGGKNYIDPKFFNHWKDAKQQKLKRGAYHFYYTADNPEVQAEFFSQTVLKLSDNKDLPPTLDLETRGVNSTISVEEYQEGVKTWLKIVEERFGRKPIIYASTNFANQYLNNPFFSSYHLWVANYDTEAPEVPSAWQKASWTFWQDSDDAKVIGIPGTVDHDYFNGTMKELNQL
ncbi:glycoside hydrolase family 25 protein [Tenacibaculum aiptasiae]|uniref:glycoside hydrolase family 25 protein n=1 Tax=Tenacibaculum aiptasiae TaxID=426481 RepID=UPI003B5A3A90